MPAGIGYGPQARRKMAGNPGGRGSPPPAPPTPATAGGGVFDALQGVDPEGLSMASASLDGRPLRARTMEGEDPETASSSRGAADDPRGFGRTMDRAAGMGRNFIPAMTGTPGGERLG